MSEAAKKAIGRLYLWAEMFFFYLAPPLVLHFTDSSRRTLFTFLWTAAGGVLAYLLKGRGFSLRAIWEGKGWSEEGKKRALIRFFALIPALAVTTLLYAPDRFLTFPVDRTGLWVAVMILYPILSACPQSLLFRSFFFARYEKLFSRPWAAVALNGLFFGFAHSLYGNWIAPVFAALGGMIFAASYRQHRSLKWAMIEHGAYGCLIFTLGIGWFFFKHG